MLFRRRAVVEEEPVADRMVEREVHGSFDPAAIFSLIAGLFYAVMGTLVLLDTGFSGFPDEPATEVFDLTHTPLVGAIDIGVGILLIVAAAVWGRGLMSFVSAVLVVAGIVVVAAPEDLPTSLATEWAYGWIAIVVGAVLLLAAMVLPSVSTHRRVVDTH